MRVSLEWLSEYVDVPNDVSARRELFARMEMAGLAIEAIHDLTAGAAGIWAGRVRSIEPHPQAAHLQLVELDLGPHGRNRVVSGASNYRVGQMVPVVVPGGRLPGGEIIKATEVRGVVSAGMMCSPAELGMGEGPEAREGILILAADVAPGADCLSLLGLCDQVLELDLTPNYAVFCQSMLGVAREVAALTGGTLREPAVYPDELTGPLSSARQRKVAAGDAARLASVEIADPELCPRYSGALFADIAVDRAPWWMQRRLIAAGMRPINKIVDVTNYVMLELGQPLHAFDLDELVEGRVIVRRATAGERLGTLDGVERDLPEGALLIADPSGPIALAGVMGGAHSEVTAETRRVFLESASFARTSVRRTSRRLGLRSEASSRFEKGLDPALTVRALERASELLAALGGGTRIEGVIDVVARPVAPLKVAAEVPYLRTLLGVDLDGAEMAALLERLGIGAEVVGDGATEVIQAVVPTRRLDIEGRADLGEEIARAYGYDRIEAALPDGPMPAASLPASRVAVLRGQRPLLAAGLHEMVTFAYHSRAEFDRLRLPADHPWRRAIEIINPMSDEQGVLRTSLVPNLVKVASHNAGHGVLDQRLFEFGRVYLPSALPPKELPEEPLRCALLVMGRPEVAGGWQRPEPPADFYTLKGLVERLLDEMAIWGASFRPVKLPLAHPGRTASIELAGEQLGWLGELHPEVAGAYDLPQRAYVAEIDWDKIMVNSTQPPVFGGLPRFPAVERDLALVVPRDLPAADVMAAVREAGGPLLEQVELFDVYEGQQIAPGQRSLAFGLRLRAPDRTLTDETADQVCGQVVAAVAKLGGHLRS